MARVLPSGQRHSRDKQARWGAIDMYEGHWSAAICREIVIGALVVARELYVMHDYP